MNKSFLGFLSLLHLSALVGCDLNPDNDTRSTDAGGPRECRSSDDCSDVCDTVQGMCVKYFEAACPSDGDQECERFDGLPLCVDQACVQGECIDDQDCAAEAALPGVVCTNGRCTNAMWGCVGEPDDREETTGTTTYEVKVVDASTQMMPKDLKITVCGGQNDPACVNGPPLGTTSIEIDHATKIVRVRGLYQGMPMHMILSASEVFPTEFYSQRPLRGKKTVELGPVLLLPKSMTRFEKVTGVKADPVNNGTLLARFFDCENKSAAGLMLTTTDTQSKTRLVYINRDNVADPKLTATDHYGAAGLVNIPTIQATFTGALDGKEVESITLVPQKGQITQVHFYPRNYSPE